MHKFRISASVFGMILVTCTQQPNQPEWSNPFDKTGTDYHPPVVSALTADTVVSWRDTVTLRVMAADSNGSIQKYIWKRSSSSVCDTTTDPTWRISKIDGGHEYVTVGAIDDDGLIGYATIGILFNRRPEKISLVYPYEGYCHIFDEIDFSDTIGTVIAYGLRATDPDWAFDSLRYAVELHDSAYGIVRRYETEGDSIWLDSLRPGRQYFLTCKAYDRYGDSIESRISFYSQAYFPKGMVYFPRDPQHGVHHPFWIDTTEVTNKEYGQYCGYDFKDTSLRPVVIFQKPETYFLYNVYNGLYYGFFKNLNNEMEINQPGLGMRLPSQAEWVRAYKNPDSPGQFYWGAATHQDVVKKYAWYELNADPEVWVYPHADTPGPQVIAQLLPNEYGLYDMSGNVLEFVANRKRKSAEMISINTSQFMGGSYKMTVVELAPFTPTGWGMTGSVGFRKVFGQIYE